MMIDNFKQNLTTSKALIGNLREVMNITLGTIGVK